MVGFLSSLQKPTANINRRDLRKMCMEKVISGLALLCSVGVANAESGPN